MNGAWRVTSNLKGMRGIRNLREGKPVRAAHAAADGGGTGTVLRREEG
jgi:hypothetical protein